MGEASDAKSMCPSFMSDVASYDHLIKVSADDDYKACFCERIGEGGFVCGWDPRHKKSLLRIHEKEPKKSSSSSSSSSSYGVSVISAHWNNVKTHIPNLRPWINKGNKAESDAGGDVDYVFKHRDSAKDYMEDYRKKFSLGGPFQCSVLGTGDCPDPYITKLKHCG